MLAVPFTCCSDSEFQILPDACSVPDTCSILPYACCSILLCSLLSDACKLARLSSDSGFRTFAGRCHAICRMSSAASRPSVDQPAPAPALKRNSDDVGWEYGVLIDPNDLNVIKCKLCPKVVKAGIYRLKLHIAGKKGEVRPCPNATPEDKEKCRKAIEESGRA